MRFRCPDCDARIDAADDRPFLRCPDCGRSVRTADARAPYDDDEDHPRRDRFDVARPSRPPAAWPRLFSPGLLGLALLLLPLPWVEVRCNPGPTTQPNFHYAQTGAQLLSDGHTDLNAAAGIATTRAREPRPARQSLAILWVVTMAAAVVLGLIPALGCRIAHLCCTAMAFLLLPALLLVILFGEAFNSVTFTPWPLAAFLLTTAALITGIVVFARQGAGSGEPPRAWDDYDEDEDDGYRRRLRGP